MTLRSILFASTVLISASVLTPAVASVSPDTEFRPQASPAQAVKEMFARRGRGRDDGPDHDADDDHGEHGPNHTWKKD
ncbi:MAG: hypothetical protein ACRCYS_15180, partial [Beijerinckiaceae bacterium]